MGKTILIAAVAIVLLTVLYKRLPFREAEGTRPSFALLPKYKKSVKHSLSSEALQTELSRFGFEKVKETDAVCYFSRGSVLGDFSTNLAKVNVTLRTVAPDEHELTVQAGWMAAFDTGDHWLFITELVRELENA